MTVRRSCCLTQCPWWPCSHRYVQFIECRQKQTERNMLKIVADRLFSHMFISHVSVLNDAVVEKSCWPTCDTERMQKANILIYFNRARFLQKDQKYFIWSVTWFSFPSATCTKPTPRQRHAIIMYCHQAISGHAAVSHHYIRLIDCMQKPIERGVLNIVVTCPAPLHVQPF